jgi:hypothetical protein
MNEPYLNLTKGIPPSIQVVIKVLNILSFHMTIITVHSSDK